MKNTPIDFKIAQEVIDSYHLPDFGKATIREVVAISNELEQRTGQEFIHMEMGVPGLKPAQVGVDAEIKALQDGIASIYPNINGLERTGFTFYQGFHQCRYFAGRMCTGDRLDAGFVCFVSGMRTMYTRKRHHSVHRSGFPGAETADYRDGISLRIVRRV